MTEINLQYQVTDKCNFLHKKYLRFNLITGKYESWYMTLIVTYVVSCLYKNPKFE